MQRSELIERLEKAEGPDRELDAEIDAAFFGGRPSHSFNEDNGGARLRRSYGPGTVFLHDDSMHNGGNVLLRHYRAAGSYTASLDAAIGLVERLGEHPEDLLPEAIDWLCTTGFHPKGLTSQIARALLIALLRALESTDAAS